MDHTPHISPIRYLCFAPNIASCVFILSIYQPLFKDSGIISPTTLSPIIMVQWKTTLNERKLTLEIHQFSTVPWIMEGVSTPHYQH